MSRKGSGQKTRDDRSSSSNTDAAARLADYTGAHTDYRPLSSQLFDSIPNASDLAVSLESAERGLGATMPDVAEITTGIQDMATAGPTASAHPQVTTRSGSAPSATATATTKDTTAKESVKPVRLRKVDLSTYVM